MRIGRIFCIIVLQSDVRMAEEKAMEVENDETEETQQEKLDRAVRLVMENKYSYNDAVKETGISISMLRT